MKSAWRYAGILIWGLAAPAALAQPDAAALTVPEYIALLDKLALDMELDNFTAEMRGLAVASAAKLPQIGVEIRDILAECESQGAQAENGQAKFETVGAARGVSDDYLAELSDCYAELSGELPASHGETASPGS